MALRAKKPIVTEQPRLKVLLYAAAGSGKTHLCCSFPNTYYIDTEKLEDYPHFIKMLHDNGSDLVYLTELNEIITEVKTLLSVKHNYKTLVIDSISFPYAWLAQMEAERMQRKAPHTEGTEFGANLAKAKRLTYQLGILLSMLDMNVIVVAHERIKFDDGKESGRTFDISDKMAYSLGSVWNIRLQGKNRKLYVEKSRYPELKSHDVVDFNDGYAVLAQTFGTDIFTREAKVIELASAEQIAEFNRLIALLAIPEESVQTKLRTAKTPTLEALPRTTMDKWLEQLNSKINGKQQPIQGDQAL